MIDKVIFAISFALMMFAYLFQKAIQETYGVKVFYPLTGLAYIGFIYAYQLKLTNVNFKIFVKVVLASAISNLLDELIMANTEGTILEYISFVITTTIIVTDGHRRKRGS